MQKVDGQSVFSYAHKRSLKVKTLASSKNVKVSEDRSIDPVVSQTGDLRLDDVMSYELCLLPDVFVRRKGHFASTRQTTAGRSSQKLC